MRTSGGRRRGSRRIYWTVNWSYNGDRNQLMIRREDVEVGGEDVIILDLGILVKLRSKSEIKIGKNRLLSIRFFVSRLESLLCRQTIIRTRLQRSFFGWASQWEMLFVWQRGETEYLEGEKRRRGG